MRRLGRGNGCVRVLLLAFVLAACEREKPPPAADVASLRQTAQGAVVGFTGEYGSHVWLGVPYAAPPVGGLRWRAPRRPEAWKGTREALRFGPPCTQYASPLGGVSSTRPGTPVGSEDCLYLNIYAPPFAPDAVPRGDGRLPVMLWIHGGGNTIGEGGFYNGGNLAVTGDVIVVTLNYRLGPFGWLYHPALAAVAADEHDASGNFGTLDLIRALLWVRENISAFGGDPGNVTIFGESAGGQNVYSLLVSPAAAGLFHRAIVQSGGFWFDTPEAAADPTTAEKPGRRNSSSEVLARLLVADGVAADRTAAAAQLDSMSAAEVAAYLRGKSSTELLSAYEPWESGMIDMPKVFRDGSVLPRQEPRSLLAQGRYHQVPVMIGTTRDENKLFMFGDPAHVRRILWIFWRLRDERTYNLTAEYLARWWKADGADEPAAAMRAVQGPSVYVYRFDWDEEPTILGADLSIMLGAAHGLEIPFVFGHFDLGPLGNRIFTAENEPGRKELSAKMMSYWAAFAHDGRPGRGRGGELLEWQPWDDSSPQAPRFIILDTQSSGGTRMSSESLTRAKVLAEVDTDPRLSAPRDRCAVLRALTASSRGLEKSEYSRRCPQYAFEAYPWS